MRLGAVADVHGDETLAAFGERLAAMPPVDLFLLGGDITDGGSLPAFRRVMAALRGVHGGPVVGIFGNNEYGQDQPKFRAAFPDVRFLDDEALDLRLGGQGMRIVGTTGSLDKPTWWQQRNIPGIQDLYVRRAAVVRDLLSHGPPLRILLTHYAPTFATMEGEKRWYWDQLGSLAMERVILETLPALVLHGHVHKGRAWAELRRRQQTLDAAGPPPAVPVYNIAFAERKEITVLDLPARESP